MARLMQMVPAPEEMTTYYVWDDGSVTYRRDGAWHLLRIPQPTQVAEMSTARALADAPYHAADIAVED